MFWNKPKLKYFCVLHKPKLQLVDLKHSTNASVAHICMCARAQYLSPVISHFESLRQIVGTYLTFVNLFTLTIFGTQHFQPGKTKDYLKRKYALFGIQSEKVYTLTDKFRLMLSLASVTNIGYVRDQTKSWQKICSQTQKYLLEKVFV